MEDSSRELAEDGAAAFKMPGLPVMPAPLKVTKPMPTAENKSGQVETVEAEVGQSEQDQCRTDGEGGDEAAEKEDLSGEKSAEAPAAAVITVPSLKVSPAEMAKANLIPLPYQEPSWGGLPAQRYAVEVIKNGSVLETHPLQDKSFFVVGRLANCDIVLEHPSLSRSVKFVLNCIE